MYLFIYLLIDFSRFSYIHIYLWNINSTTGRKYIFFYFVNYNDLETIDKYLDKSCAKHCRSTATNLCIVKMYRS